MSATAYYQTLTIPSLSLAVQNYDAFAAGFLPFEVSNYTDNACNDADELTITFPLGTLRQADVENLITKGSTVVVTGTSGTQTFWTFTGRVTDAQFNLTAVALTVGSPLRPISGSVQLPGVVPFRVLTTANAGKLPLTGRS